MGFFDLFFGRGAAQAADEEKRAEIAGLNEQIRHAGLREQTLVAQIREIEISLANNKDEVANLLHELNSSKRERTLLSESVGKKRSRVLFLAAQVKALEKSLEIKEEEIAALNNELASSKIKEKSLSETVENSEVRIESLTARLAQADALAQSLSDRLNAVEKSHKLSLVRLELFEAEADFLREQACLAKQEERGRQLVGYTQDEAPTIQGVFKEQSGADHPYRTLLADQPTGTVRRSLQDTPSEDGSESTDDPEWVWRQSVHDDDGRGPQSPPDIESFIDSLPESTDDLGDDEWTADDTELNLSWVQNSKIGESSGDIESILAEESYFADDVGPTTRDLLGERARSYSREERAEQIALKLVEEYSLPMAALPALASIFAENWWGSAKSAVISLLDRGASYEEVILTFKLRKLWADNGQFSTYFLSSKEPTIRKSVLPWLVAFDFVRSFKGVPDIEELEQYLIESVEFWLSRRFLHDPYPSYLLYLKGIIDSRREGEIIAPPRSTGRLPL